MIVPAETAIIPAMTLLDLAAKFERAGFGREEDAITQEDLNLLGIKLQKTFKSKKYGRINVERGWESFCSFVYEKVTGEPCPGSTLHGTGFRSQAYGRLVAEAIRSNDGK